MKILIKDNNCLVLTSPWPDNFAPKTLTVTVTTFTKALYLFSEPEAYVEVFGSVINQKATIPDTELPGVYQITVDILDVGSIKKITVYLGQEFESNDDLRRFSISDISFFPEPIGNKIPLQVINCSFSDRYNHCYLPTGFPANRTPKLYREYTDYDLDNKPWEYTRSDKLGIRFRFDDDPACLATTTGCIAPATSERLEGEGEVIMVCTAVEDATLRLKIDSVVSFTNNIDKPHFADVRVSSFDENCHLSVFETVSEMKNSDNDPTISTCMVGNQVTMSLDFPNQIVVKAGSTYVISFRVKKKNTGNGGCGSFISFSFEKLIQPL
jgi:hypothetical protein